MSDYDAMTEREVMQLRVLRVAYQLEDACGPNGLLGPYSAEQADIVRGLLDDLHAVSDWLDAQPPAAQLRTAQLHPAVCVAPVVSRVGPTPLHE